MVKAELSYNPYIMETQVKFNGQPPRINSLIEKYQDRSLQDWIDHIPSIFFDEMNGFDFELDFSGTILDYEEVKKAFLKAGITDDQVVVFMKNELESRETKTEEINQLLDWLRDNPNRKYDNSEFRQKNQELFDDDYTFIILHGNSDYEEYDGVSIETVDSIEELENTNLTHTPIMIYVSNDTIQFLSNDLKTILNRSDIDSKQLLFYIAQGLPRNKVKRIIIDLGIKDPIVVTDLFDENVNKYFLLYPISDYIYNSIKAFRNEAERISSILDVENAKCESEGREIHLHLDLVEGKLKALKYADELIKQRDNLEPPQEFIRIKDTFILSIAEWKLKKTKINKMDEAKAVATEFNTFLHTAYGEFCSQIEGAFKNYADDIKKVYSEWCLDAIGTHGDIESINTMDKNYPAISEQGAILMDIKEEKYVMPESNLIGRLFRTSDNSAEKKPVLETTYYYQAWREHMVNVAKPATEELIKKRFELLKQYYDRLAVIYHDMIVKQIEVKTAEKDEVSSKLSDEEKVLQIDNDWLSEFTDRIKSIERS